jgi:hypothetical protein
MEEAAGEDQESQSYVMPKLTVSETHPFLQVEGTCSPAIKDIVAQANKILQNVSAQSSGDEFKRFVQKRLDQTTEMIMAQVKKEDQEVDKSLVRKEVLEKCKEMGIAKAYANFRFHVAVKGAPIGKGVVVRVNPRSGEAFIWQLPQEGQDQHEAKILIVVGKHQNEVLGRPFVKGERTDGLTAGKRGA